MVSQKGEKSLPSINFQGLCSDYVSFLEGIRFSMFFKFIELRGEGHEKFLWEKNIKKKNTNFFEGVEIF